MTSFAPLAPASRQAPQRSFGRFALRLLLGTSRRTLVWLVFDPRHGQELVLTMPRVPPADAASLDAWLANARSLSRLDHPRLAHVVEVGTHEQWPYLTFDRALGVTLAEWLAEHPLPDPAQSAGWVAGVLEGLAFIHEAGLLHGDPQLHHLVVDGDGHVRLLGAGAAVESVPADATPADTVRAMTIDPARLRAQRHAAQRDVLAIGLVLHQLLAGATALEEPDTSLVIDRLAPAGRETLTLPWTTPHPLPEALRTIANRATVAHDRHRYVGARSLQRALDGWSTAQSQEQGGVIALLLDRLSTIGHLPAMPGATAAVARLAGSADTERTDEMAAQILQDMALAFEMLRLVNSAQVQATQAAGNGPVLTIRRAIALIGTDGIRRAAHALRAWPGPLGDEQSQALRRLIDRVRFAGHVAQALRPAGYDAEVVYLVAVMQNIGRLLVQYHFADDAEQMRRLMRPAKAAADEVAVKAPKPLPESAAAQAVLGVEIDAITAAVAHHWGLGGDVQQLLRRADPAKPVRSADDDLDLIRLTASAANEAVDALGNDASGAAAAIERIAQRYARALRIDGDALRDALKSARATMRGGAAPSAQPPTDPAIAPATAP